MSSSEVALPVRWLGRVADARPPRSRRADAHDPRHGRRRLHDGARTTPRSTTSSCRWRARREPRILFLPTASGDPNAQIARVPRRRSATAPAAPRHLSLFRLEQRARTTCATLILAQDVVYVGGGSMRNLLAIWREHGLDEILREAWERGRRAGRAQRRRDVLVRARHHALDRAARSRRRRSASCRAACRVHYDGDPTAGRSTSTRSRAARSPPATAPTTASACSSTTRGSCGSSPRGRARAPTACERGDGAGAVSRRGSSPSCSPPSPRVRSRDVPDGHPRVPRRALRRRRPRRADAAAGATRPTA